jgi:hypothetical protein
MSSSIFLAILLSSGELKHLFSFFAQLEIWPASSGTRPGYENNLGPVRVLAYQLSYSHISLKRLRTGKLKHLFSNFAFVR